MGLLEVLAQEMDIEILSKLRYLPRPCEALRRAVAKMPLDGFSEWEWIDAADYLCSANCSTAEEARNTILERV